MDSVRVHVVEVDTKRMTVGMFNQIQQEEYKDGDALKGEPLGWIYRKKGSYGDDEKYLLWVKRGELADELRVDTPRFWSEKHDCAYRAAWACAVSVVRATPDFVMPADDASTHAFRREVAELATRYVRAYEANAPSLDPIVYEHLSREVSQLEQQHRMLEALPQLYVGR